MVFLHLGLVKKHQVLVGYLTLFIIHVHLNLVLRETLLLIWFTPLFIYLFSNHKLWLGIHNLNIFLHFFLLLARFWLFHDFILSLDCLNGGLFLNLIKGFSSIIFLKVSSIVQVVLQSLHFRINLILVVLVLIIGSPGCIKNLLFLYCLVGLSCMNWFDSRLGLLWLV